MEESEILSLTGNCSEINYDKTVALQKYNLQQKVGIQAVLKG